MSDADVLMLSVSGCRGIIGTSLTPDVTACFASAFAQWLAARPGKGNTPVTIVLGRDGRRGSDLFAGIARSALLACGCDVIDLDIAMTPTVGVMVDQAGADGGLMISASNNPQPWCGLKPIIRRPGLKAGVPDAAAPDKATADQIITRYHQTAAPRVKDWRSLGHARVEPELTHGHLGVVRRALGDATLKKLARLRTGAVIDNLGMSGATMSDWAVRTLCPAAVIEQLYESTGDLARTTDRGLFPHTPEPLKENLTALAKAVKKHGGDVGFAQDPDADRLAVIDERGVYIGEEYTLVLCAMALGELGGIRKGDKIVVNLSTSRMIEDVAARYGAKVLRSAVGEANVVELMKKHKAAFGGEGNGGVIWPKVTYIRDSLSAMALVLALMAKTRQPISKLVAGTPAYAIVKRKVALASREIATAAGEKVARAYASERVDRTDGVRVDLVAHRAWLHVRASNTEPIMRLIAEAPTIAEANAILDDAARVIG